MTDRAAMSASYADLKFIKTRKVAQIVLEIPIEQAQQFISLFGAPQPHAEAHVAIARLDIPAKQESPPQAKPEPLKAHRAFEELPLPQQAALRCEDMEFREFLRFQKQWHWVKSAEDAAVVVRGFCGVNSRADIKPGRDAAIRWGQLNNRFLLWKSAQAA